MEEPELAERLKRMLASLSVVQVEEGSRQSWEGGTKLGDLWNVL
jgi:hypothetical protein